YTVVVGVEQHPEGRMERLEAGFARFQDEGLEEPGGVRQVPLDRAGIRHRLGTTVLGRQGYGQVHRTLAHVLEGKGDGGSIEGSSHDGSISVNTDAASMAQCESARAWITANQLC